MDYSAQLDQLQQRVAQTKSAVQAATSESRERLRQRIDQTQADLDQTGKHAQHRWAQMKADAAAKRDDVKAKIDQRNRQMNARAAADEADWAEGDAADALDYAAWTVDNAQLTVLDAIDARAYADQRANSAAGA